MPTNPPHRFQSRHAPYTTPAGDKGLVVVVGPCASGKSTLAERLRAQGYGVRAAAQEHSYVPTLWQMSEPDFLIYLHAALPTVRARRHNPRWSEAEWLAQQARLAHARQHADAVIATDALTVEQVEVEALRVLATLADRPRSRQQVEQPAAAPPLRRRFEIRRAIADDLLAIQQIVGSSFELPLLPSNGVNTAPLEGDHREPDRAGCLVAVATDTPKASLYAHYRGEIIAVVTYGLNRRYWAAKDEPSVIEVDAPRIREVGFNRRAVLTRLLRAVPKAVADEVTRLRHTADATSPTIIAEFKAVGYKLVRHEITLSDSDLNRFVTTKGEANSALLLDYEAQGLQVISEADIYELPIHQGGFSLSEYLRQQPPQPTSSSWGEEL